MEQIITIDDDYSVVRRPRNFKVNGKTVGHFKFYYPSASWKFIIQGKNNAVFNPNQNICDELNEEILKAILDELKRLNSTYRGI